MKRFPRAQRQNAMGADDLRLLPLICTRVADAQNSGLRRPRRAADRVFSCFVVQSTGRLPIRLGQAVRQHPVAPEVSPSKTDRGPRRHARSRRFGRVCGAGVLPRDPLLVDLKLQRGPHFQQKSKLPAIPRRTQRSASAAAPCGIGLDARAAVSRRARDPRRARATPAAARRRAARRRRCSTRAR